MKPCAPIARWLALTLANWWPPKSKPRRRGWRTPSRSWPRPTASPEKESERRPMPAAERRVTRDDIVANEVFAAERKARRAALLPAKRLRQVALGPVCTLYFENFDTMLFQIQEMLLIEKGGAEQLADELAAYNPLIPQGKELVATVMLEIEDPVRRAAVLGELGGVEEHFFLQIDITRVFGVPEGDIERTRDDGKTSA